MEQSDLDLIARYEQNNPALATLWKEHCNFERQLSKLESKPFLTATEQLERNRLKKLKLAGRDQIEQILNQYRNTAA
ncbi:MAG: YdcH family protein [Deltaproteobacteria bacterium]|nr:YdcH family protein [Deltaproteobacteria bacterium]